MGRSFCGLVVLLVHSVLCNWFDLLFVCWKLDVVCLVCDLVVATSHSSLFGFGGVWILLIGRFDPF